MPEPYNEIHVVRSQRTVLGVLTWLRAFRKYPDSGPGSRDLLPVETPQQGLDVIFQRCFLVSAAFRLYPRYGRGDC